MDALIALVRKDVVLYLANRRALLVTLAAPILIAAFFGSVLGGAPKKPSKIPIAIADLDASPVSRDIVARMRADSAFDLKDASEADGVVLVREGKVRATAVIPAGFGDAAPKAMFRRDMKKPEILVHYDPSQVMALPLVKGLLAEHVMASVGRAAFGGMGNTQVVTDAKADVAKSTALADPERRDLLAMLESVEKVQSRYGSATAAGGDAFGPSFSLPFETREDAVTSGPASNYNGYAHSFAGMGVQFVLFMGIEMGVGLLLMRRMGLWKRLRAAPVSRTLLLGSRIVSGALIASLLLAGIFAAAILVFGVRIEGSVVGFVLVSISFAILTATFGLLIAALGNTPEATRGLAILATLLLVMLGGAWIPTFVFPEWLQSLTQFVPTRWAIDGMEAMTWRGLGIEAVWKPVGAMLATSLAFGWIAMKRFAWEE